MASRGAEKTLVERPALPADVEEVCARFEAAWRSGARPSIEDYHKSVLAGLPAEARRQLLVELVICDLGHRWAARAEKSSSTSATDETVGMVSGLSDHPLLADYQASHPELGNSACWPVELVSQEYRVLRFAGNRPNRREYLRRYAHLAATLPVWMDEIDVECLAAQEARGADGAAELPVPLAEFVQRLGRSGLMLEAEIAAWQAGLPPNEDPVSAVTALVRAGKLTAYQVRRICEGQERGLAFGEYALLDLIGGGGMGQVYLARHRSMDRIVALKVLAPKRLESSDAVKRFQREVRAAARLSHPNIVTAYDAGRHEELYYLVMEYVDGEDLSRMGARLGPLPVDQAVDYMIQAARGLQYAHERGVIHRDIKPGNLLADREGNVRILDMGLARLDASTAGSELLCLTAPGQAMGTLGYMAPEQALDTRLADTRSDIYSLGCTLYWLLIGESPFPTKTLVQLLSGRGDVALPSIRNSRPDVPQSLDRVFQKMVARRPDDRFQTMGEVIAALEAARDAAPDAGHDVATPLQPAPVDHGPGRHQGSRPLWMAVAVAALFLALLSAWRLWIAAPQRPQKPATEHSGQPDRTPR